MKALFIIWIIIVIAFAGYKSYEYFERKKVLEKQYPSTSETVTEHPKQDDTTKEPEFHTVIPSSNKIFSKNKVYTNEDIKKMNEKRLKKKGVITEEEMKKYHQK